MPEPTTDLLAAFRNVAKVGPRQWSACCPGHDDERASLSISLGDNDRALLHCHAGCSFDQIIEASGLSSAELSGSVEKQRAHQPASSRIIKRPKLTKPPKASGVPIDAAIDAVARQVGGSEVGRWTYTQKNGTPAFVIVRFETPNGKEYRPFRPVGSGWKSKGLESGRPLYRLPSLSAVDQIFVFEGEKCADLAQDLGLAATTSAHGANSPSKTDWSPLAGREVILVPDHDNAGDAYIGAVAKILLSLSPEPKVKILRLPGFQNAGDDLEQFIEHRRCTQFLPDVTAHELVRLADKADRVDTTDYRGGPVLVSLADLEPEEVEWLWPGRIPLGKLTMIAGDPGLGKSFTTLDMAARVSTGKPWPDDPNVTTKVGSVIIMSIEDDLADTVVPRLNAAGADRSRIIAMSSVKCVETGKIKERIFNLETDIPRLAEAIERTPNVRLVVIDPVSAFTGKTDSHKNTDVRSMLAPLQDLAAKHRVAVVCVTHLNKNAAGPVMYRSIGSIAYNAAARAVWGVVKDQKEANRRLFLPVKNNLAPDGHGLAYRLTDSDIRGVARVAWDSVPVDVPAEEAFGAPHGGSRSPRNEAEDFLRDLLAEGPVSATDAISEAESNGITEKTLRRAAKAINVQKRKVGMKGGWEWSLSSAGEVEDAEVAEAA